MQSYPAPYIILSNMALKMSSFAHQVTNFISV